PGHTGGTSMSNNEQVSDGKLSSGAGYEVGVLGSARLTENDAWWGHARKLGMLLAGEGFVVVTGGYGGPFAGRRPGTPRKRRSSSRPNHAALERHKAKFLEC